MRLCDVLPLTEGVVVSFIDADLKCRYDYFNTLLFDGILPQIPVEYTKLKTMGGVVRAKVRTTQRQPSDRLMMRLGLANGRHAGSKELVPGSMRLQISTLYQREPEAMDAILVHEMIHVLFFSNGDFTEQHGFKFQAKVAELSRKAGFTVPLTDNVTGLSLTRAPTRHVGVIVIHKPGQTSVAVVSEKYMTQNLAALKERWDSFLRYDNSIRVQFLVGSGRIQARYPVQRKKVIAFYILNEPDLLSEFLRNANVLATLDGRVELAA